MKYSIKLICFLLISGAVATASGQTKNILTFDEFLDNVKNKNLSYLAEQYNIDIANANIQAAKVFPNPNLSLGGSDNQEQALKMGYSFDGGLDYTLELGNKRKARIRLAESEAALSGALLEDYFRNLKANATLAYVSTIKQIQLYNVLLSSHSQMTALANADSIRFKLGEINEVDAKQSRLEANLMFNEVLQQEMELKNALVNLSVLQGDSSLPALDSITGVLSYKKHDFDLLTLIETAQNNRADLQAALKSKEVSQRNLQLAKANRAIDLGVNLGVSRNAEVRNEIAPAPAFTSVSAGISIPLKFSNTNKGEVRSAQLSMQQSELNYQAIEKEIRAEVIQVYNAYVASCRQVEHYNTYLLADTKSIYERKIYSYQRGETGLLEVLNAQRTYNEIQTGYLENLYNYMSSLVELQRTVGSQDIGYLFLQ